MSQISKQFEKVTRAIFWKLREHFGYGRVEGSHYYPAQDSGVRRQIDITAYETDGGMILLECKRHTNPVDIGYIDAFHTVIHTDIGAAGGIMVSAGGFTAGAVKSANAKRIGLATLNADATEYEFQLRIADLLISGTTRTSGMRLRLKEQEEEMR